MDQPHRFRLNCFILKYDGIAGILPQLCRVGLMTTAHSADSTSHQQATRPSPCISQSCDYFKLFRTFMAFCCHSWSESNLQKFEVGDFNLTWRLCKVVRAIGLLVRTNICVYRLFDAKTPAVKKADHSSFLNACLAADTERNTQWRPRGWKKKRRPKSRSHDSSAIATLNARGYLIWSQSFCLLPRGTVKRREREREAWNLHTAGVSGIFFFCCKRLDKLWLLQIRVLFSKHATYLLKNKTWAIWGCDE